MSKDKSKVVERLRARILPENQIFVKKNLEISEQVAALLKERNWSQKELAIRLRKSESEVSKLLSGLHNLTLKSISKMEAELGNDIIVTPLEACKKYKTTEYITFKVYIPTSEPIDDFSTIYVSESNFDYNKTYQKPVRPELITILSVKIFRSTINTTDEYMNNPIKNEGVEILVEQNTAFNIEKKNIRIRLNIDLEARINKSEPIGLSGNFVLEFHIQVENLEQFIIEVDDKKLIDSQLGGTLNGIVYSTARGIIFERTATSAFRGVILPVIDPNLLLNKN